VASDVGQTSDESDAGQGRLRASKTLSEEQAEFGEKRSGFKGGRDSRSPERCIVVL
jgi:hypothetical protein